MQAYYIFKLAYEEDSRYVDEDLWNFNDFSIFAPISEI